MNDAPAQGLGEGMSEAKRKLLARMLGGSAPAPRGLEAPISPRAAGTVAPISADQRNVWLHATTAGDVPIYNEPVTIHRAGPFDLPVFERTMREVLRRHEIWRTSLEVRNGEPVQVVHEDVALPIAFDDLTALPESSRDAEAVRLAAADVALPLDLSRAPLLRVRVVRLAPERHRIYLTLHHLVFDGVSVHRVLPDEIAAIYAAFAAGRDHALPPPPVQYGDYALWREQARTAPAMVRQLDYWRAELAGDPDPIRLPTDRPRPPVAGFEGGSHRFALPPALVERVRALARARGATVYMVTLAVYQALLFRYAGQDDLVVGAIVDLRRRPELRDLLGYFLNAVALRTAPRAELPFTGLLAQVKAKLLGALENADVPFDEVVRAVAPRRDPGAAPVFQVLFSIQPPPERPPPGWDLTQMDVPTGVAKFDLYLELEERVDGLLGRFIYRTDLFDPPTIERMAGHYLTLLGGVADDPERPLGRLPMLTEAERRDLLHTWNFSAHPMPEATLPELIAAQARRVPVAVAVTGAERSLTYAEFDRRTARLCGLLRRAGAGPGALVAVCANRTPDLIVALVAVLRAGAAYIPLDPALPRPRFEALLADARPKIVLTEMGLLGVLPGTETPIVLLDDIDLADADTFDTPPAPSPRDLAYVLYTSGSTGAPKGVEIEHRSLVNLLAGMGSALGISEADVVLATTTVSFDIAAVELFLPLMLGGRIVMASRDDVVDPRRLIALIASSGCTMLQATPAAWRGLVAAGWEGKPELLVLSGGEALPRSLARDLMWRSRAVWNGYGPTETTIYSAAHRLVDEDGPVPIGRPTANTRLYLLDTHGELVPVGVPGELHIAGDGLARGYRGRADLTAGRFLTRPGVPGERLYATGDLVRQRPDGQMVWVARIDTQVKVRGYRVELGEVTETLARHPAVAAAAVVDYHDPAGETGLLACTVARDGAAPTPADLRGFLRQSLPEYVVPARYLAVETLPLTPNGKVDRSALLALADAAPPGSATTAPLSPAGRALAPIWREVLGVRTADASDNFFEVGGHSLLAARLLMAIDAQLGRRLSMTDIFRAQTFGEIAGLLGERERVAPPAPSEAAELRALLTGFESLGEDCEFGLLQRRFGAEPLGLFRFADLPLPVLIGALERDLTGIDDLDLLELGYDPVQRTRMIRHRALGFGYILFDRVDDADPAATLALRMREARRLGFLRRKFLEDLAQGGKVWVLKASAADGAAVRRLLHLLRARGPAVLLWVELADATHDPGSVARTGVNGLLHARIDRFAPPEAMHDSSLAWLEICRQAHDLDVSAEAGDVVSAGMAGSEVVRHAGAAIATVCWSRLATDDAAMAESVALSSETARRHSRRYRLDRDRRRFLARRAAVRRMLAGRLGRDPATLDLRRTALGKPYLGDMAIAFSVSYVDDWMLLATSTARSVGCDLACRATGPIDWPGADRLFSAREVAAMRAGTASGAATSESGSFIRAWTLKEACGKAVGCGLLGPLDEFDTTGIADQPRVVDFAGGEWIARCWECMPGYQAAIVVAGADFAPIS